MKIKWPKHEGGMTIEHNPHLALYQSVEKYAACSELVRDGWISDDEKQLALETGELWILTWYPDTPVGFCTAVAASFEALIVFSDEYVDNVE